MFLKKRAENGVEFFISDILPCTHGFSTRIGGASVLSHTSSLNLAFGRGDDRDTVLCNVSRFADAVGFPADELISVPQIHSDVIIDANKEMLGEGVFKDTDKAGDGYIITERGVFAAVKTADCVPILIADKNKKAVCAVHSGWRGTAKTISKNAINKMTDEYKIPKDDIICAIGPAIGKCCFEISNEVVEALSHICYYDKYVNKKSNGKYMLDLKGINKQILINCGIKEENIDVSNICTKCDKDLFYSYRRQGESAGRNAAFIMK